MKKIIATVLAMVMALALCTTAFADTQTISKDKVSAINSDGTVFTLDLSVDVVKTLESKNTSGDTTTIAPAYYTTGDGARYFECHKAVAECQLIIKGMGNVFVQEYTGSTVIEASKTATLYTAPEDATCGKVGADEDTYVVVDGKYYPLCEFSDTNVAFALVDGKLVSYDKTAEATAAEHDFDDATLKATYASDGSVTAVKCKVCEQMIAVYKKAGSYDGKSYAEITADRCAWDGYFYVVGSAPVADNGTTAGTSSPKTFDAGIAMYVGMALTSVAGSAVVIGKKKEF